MSAPPRSVAIAATVLIVAVFAAYLNGIGGPFVFDDRAAILENPGIRDLADLRAVLFPPAGGQTISGRPMVSLTLALNYAIGGTQPPGYHVLNIAIHALAALVLFGIVRRTWRLARPADGERLASGAALAVALLWSLHPLQTSAVTYVVQRAESLMGLFYLLTLYGFIRASEACGTGVPPVVRSHGRDARATQTAPGWALLSVTACVLGMATKEVMATAPLLVLLYDRTFVSGSFAAAFRARRGYYLALAGTWLLLAALVLGTAGRGGTVGLAAGISPWHYLLTQFEAIVRYLRLAVWPHPLVFDYGEYAVRNLSEVLPQAALLLALLAGTLVALRRRPALGFLAAWFFLILAPTSSLVPVGSQTIAGHRMYLPLAGVIVLIVLAILRLPDRRASFALLSALCLAAAGTTLARNRVYRSEIALWADTVAHRPQNVRAQLNLAHALLDAGRTEEAIATLEPAAQLRPDIAEIHAALGRAHAQFGRSEAAIAELETALRLQPADADTRRLLAAAHVDQAKQLGRRGVPAQARAHAAEALRLAPDDVEAQLAAGNAAAASGEFAAAIAAYRAALAIDPDHLGARNNLANALLVTGRTGEAITQYREVLRRRPDDRSVQQNLQRALELEAAGREIAR